MLIGGLGLVICGFRGVIGGLRGVICGCGGVVRLWFFVRVVFLVLGGVVVFPVMFPVASVLVCPFHL